MSKIGRNDLCPCGSGKKYKKCCMDKEEQFNIGQEPNNSAQGFKNYLDSFWSYEEADLMSTVEIIQKLESMGISFDEKAFFTDVDKFHSAEELSESWCQNFKVKAKDRDEDFPYFSALILWERLALNNNMPREKMSNLIDEGFQYLSENDAITACDVWFRVWEGLKLRFKPEFKNLDVLDKLYKNSFFVSNFCQDLECELYNAGIDNKSYFQKRIDYCREFCDYFPNEKELIIHNMKRAIAESFASLGNYGQAELECKNLVKEYPNNPWGYIQWGDIYFFAPKKDLTIAKEFYEKARSIARDKEDILVVAERLADLELKMNLNIK